jgi:hypothetical protein
MQERLRLGVVRGRALPQTVWLLVLEALTSQAHDDDRLFF